MKLLVAAVLALTALATQAHAEDKAFAIQDGERIVFFGDSITQSGQYVQYVEAYLRTRFPDRSFEVINHGISSETISGTSEPDHDPPRGDAHKRFDRDVAAWKPTMVVACFGMNDGNYHPPDEARFAKYKDGIERLYERTMAIEGARLTILTPPIFDPYRAKASDPMAVHYGYKFPALNYDETLAGYSQWLMTLDKPRLQVIDLHTAMAEHLKKRRKGQVSYTFSPDAVHPDATGHWLMAQTLIVGWNAPKLVAESVIDLSDTKATATNGNVKDVQWNGGRLTFVWNSPLPMPMDPDWDERSIGQESVSERFNRYRLTVTGLKKGDYELHADGKMIAALNADGLQAGLDLNALLPQFPTVAASQQVLDLVRKRQNAVYAQWRAAIQTPEPEDDHTPNETAEVLETQLRELCRPRDLQIEIVPAE